MYHSHTVRHTGMPFIKYEKIIIKAFDTASLEQGVPLNSTVKQNCVSSINFHLYLYKLAARGLVN